jgi:hypothetical protein
MFTGEIQMGKKTQSNGTTSPMAISHHVTQAILVIRGSKVVLDRDLAKLYGVTVRRLNEAVKRNRERFPDDFMFQLTWDETKFLRSRIATLEKNPSSHARYRPHAFTEHGAVMAASLLNSPIAV